MTNFFDKLPKNVKQTFWSLGIRSDETLKSFLDGQMKEDCFRDAPWILEYKVYCLCYDRYERLTAIHRIGSKTAEKILGIVKNL